MSMGPPVCLFDGTSWLAGLPVMGPTVVLKEGPAAIGWERWRELDADYYADLVRAFIEMLALIGLGEYASAMVAATMRGTLTELSFEIAQSSDQA
jgi:hypothetical protein